MSTAAHSSGQVARRLSHHYQGWLGPDEQQREKSLRSGLVVLDANILLALYEVGVPARAEIFKVLDIVSNRLWVPHQVAVEYSRNRRRVVEDRVNHFSEIRRVVRSCESKAVNALLSVINQVRALREKNRTERPWDLVECGLDLEALTSRLAGVADVVLKEVTSLEEEHDLKPQDMVQADSVYLRIDELLDGRIGPPVEAAELRQLVDTAMEFRFPNDIPPGHADGSKKTSLLKAGDYVLWWQLLDHVKNLANYSHVLLVTAETKPDWWNITNQKVTGPRPELVQEMCDTTGKHLDLVALADFLAGANQYLQASVSEETLRQVQHAQVEANRSALWIEALRQDDWVDIYDMPPWRLEELVAHLFEEMGYAIVEEDTDPKYGVDFVVVGTSGEAEPDKIAVEVKQHRYRTPSVAIQQLQFVLSNSELNRGILVTTGSLSPEAKDAAATSTIQVIDGPELRRLLAIHLGINIRFGPRDYPDAR